MSRRCFAIGLGAGFAARAFTLAGGMIVLSGCATYDHLSRLMGPEANGQIALGQNLVGENCVGVPMAESFVPKEAQRLYAIRCGSWTQPSGFLVVASSVPSSVASAEAPPDWWRAILAKRLTCAEKGDAAPLFEGEQAFLYTCRLTEGGWPYLALDSQLGEARYLADAVPAALPAIEQAIGVLSGKRKPEVLDPADAAALATALTDGGESGDAGKLAAEASAALAGTAAGGGAAPSYGAGDLETYRQLMAKGLFANSRRNSAEAEAAFREALTVQETALGAGTAATAEPLMHLALEISNQGRTDEAEGLFARAGKLVADGGEQALRARYWAYLALHQANKGAWDEAQKLAAQSTELRRKLYEEGAQGAGLEAGEGSVGLLGVARTGAGPELIQSLATEAVLARQQKDFKAARKALSEAQGLLARESAAPSFWRAELYEIEASLDAAEDDAGAAARAMQRAVSVREQVDPKSRPMVTGLMALGGLYRSEGATGEAQASFARGTGLIAETGETLKIGQVMPYLDALYDEAGQAKDPAPFYARMYTAAQYVRDGMTARTIAQATTRLAASDAETGKAIRGLQEAQRKRTLLQDRLSAQFALDPGLRNPTDIARLRTALDEMDALIDRQSLAVQASAPAYNKLVDTPASVERISGLLRKGEGLWQILVGPAHSYGFMVTTGGVKAYRIAADEKAIDSAVRRLRAAFAPRPDGSLRGFDTAAAHALFKELIGPLAEDLKGLAHLIVVPSGALLSLPFALLVTEPPADALPTSAHYLGEAMALSLNPSARSFADLRALTKPSGATKSFIGFGDFVPPPRKESETTPEVAGDCPELQHLAELMTPLPETEQEIKTVAAAFGGKADVVLAKDFTEDRILATPLQDYRVLYFATHGLLPSDLRCQADASLVLSSSPDGAASKLFLDAGEIQGLSLDADLVVLSACNTGGAGGKSSGESLSGLARAFFYGGARSLLVSHWSVASEQTAHLMTKLFAEATSGPDRPGLAEALRQAQIALLTEARKNPREANWAHPFFWAPFTLVGDGARAFDADGSFTH